jgi:hypothetical protein
MICEAPLSKQPDFFPLAPQQEAFKAKALRGGLGLKPPPAQREEAACAFARDGPVLFYSNVPLGCALGSCLALRAPGFKFKLQPNAGHWQRGLA